MLAAIHKLFLPQTSMCMQQILPWQQGRHSQPLCRRRRRRANQRCVSILLVLLSDEQLRKACQGLQSTRTLNMVARSLTRIRGPSGQGCTPELQLQDAEAQFEEKLQKKMYIQELQKGFLVARVG